MIKTAIEIFSERRETRAGSWCWHSEYVAEAAAKLASEIGLNSDKAYAMGLLHDVGRSFSDGQFRHIKDGYEYLLSIGHPDLSRICLTHSFVAQDIFSYVGKFDVPICDVEKYQAILKKLQYDEYDRLIQLCDSISTSNGYVLPEQKLVTNAFKYGLKETTLGRWRAVLDLYEDMEERIGYNLLTFLNSK